MNDGTSASDNDAAIISDLVSGGNSARDNDAAIICDLVNGGNSASGFDAAIVSDNSVNGDHVMINDDVEDIVVDKYDTESCSDVSEDGFSTDDSRNISEIVEDNSVITIDSDDDTAIVPSTLMTRTQTFVFTIRPKTQYVDGHDMNAIFTVERDYFDNWN